MSYKTALHHANQVLGLASKANKYIKELFDAPDVSHHDKNSIPFRRIKSVSLRRTIFLRLENAVGRLFF